MYYRMTKISHKAGDREKMVAYLSEQKSLINAINGLHSVRLVAISDTQSMGISVYDNAQQVADATETFKAIMGGMKAFFTAPPEIMHGEEFWEHIQS